ncbi:MAG: sulfurtransferase [Gaiellaceae bacterium]
MSGRGFGPLVDVRQLAEQIDEPALRIYDCGVDIVRPEAGSELTFQTDAQRAAWSERHIPGAAFADLVALSDNENGQWMMLPTPDAFAAKVGALGIGDGTRVVLYDAGMNMWAARFRWMLRVHGFDSVAVLDGGWRAWTAAGQAVSSEPAPYEPSEFTPRMRPELVVSTDEVASVVDARAAATLVNAVGREQHRGRGEFHAGRPGHIPGSVNVPYSALVDPKTHAFLSSEELKRVFDDEGVSTAMPTVAYCGGAIAACSAALALELIGFDDVAVYDGSLREWARDPGRPLITG